MRKIVSNFTVNQGNEMKQISSSLKEIQKSNHNIENSIAYLTAQNDELKNKIEHLESQAKEDRKYITVLENRIEEMQIGSRKTNFVIKNVPRKSNETKEDLIEMTMLLSENIDCKINKHDIRDIYRVRVRNKEQQNMPIIVETSTTLLKTQMLKMAKAFNVRHKTKLCCKHLGFKTQEETPIFLSEHLTTKGTRLHFLARDLVKSGKYKYCWTAYGKVYVRKDDNSPTITIRTEEQTSNPTPESSQLQQVEALTKLPETSGPTPESSQTQLVEALTKLPEAEEIILNVYNYLKTEYDTLKSVAGDSCDLSPLANILKRTAQATGVNEPTVTAILQGNNRKKPGERLKTSGKKRRKRRREVENVDLSPIEEDSDFKTTDDEQQANDDIEQMAQEHVGIETVKLEIHEEDIEHSVAMREAMMSNMEPAASGETPTVQLVMSPPYFEIKTEPVDVEFSRQPQHCTAVDPLTLDTQLGDVELPAQQAPPDPGEMDSAGSSTRERLIVTTTYNC